MSADAWLEPLRAALDGAAEPVRLFFRDDDAGWDDARLWALCDIFAAHEQPLDLAVIPAELHASLAAELRARVRGARLELHQHGLCHRNHELTGRSCEFGPSRSAEAQRADIARGWALLQDLLAGHVRPVFTPPWNRCTAATGEALVDLGFDVLSRESRATPLGVAGLRECPVHLDWMAHRGGVRVGFPELGERLARAVGETRAPVGVMLHHAVMDEDDLAAVGRLLDLVGGHPRVRTCQLLEAAGATRAASSR